ncbi:MAG: response regulator [Endomicrobium sp.]|jgi:DNA-binding NtrC family response regulator|nr:response regulator [Endomicrobium sp.]
MDKKLNILIADDEEAIRFPLASIFEMEGYNVKTAENGLEVLKLIENDDFDIAFFDIKMPEMDGVEVFKEIKKLNKKMTVVIMTADTMTELVKEAIQEGAFACISKPFEIEDVLNMIKEIAFKSDAGNKKKVAIK